MEEGRKKIWLWLMVMVLTALLAGGCYYFGTEKETNYEQEGTLVEVQEYGCE